MPNLKRPVINNAEGGGGGGIKREGERMGWGGGGAVRFCHYF